jgi:hypothetical protein
MRDQRPDVFGTAWGHAFVTNEVHTQLSAQKIFFPAKNSPEITSLPAADAAAMSKYAGQQMTTGAEAETWADHFIAVHLVKIGGGLTYSQLSAKSLAQPKNAALAAQVETSSVARRCAGCCSTPTGTTRSARSC